MCGGGGVFKTLKSLKGWAVLNEVSLLSKLLLQRVVEPEKPQKRAVKEKAFNGMKAVISELYKMMAEKPLATGGC